MGQLWAWGILKPLELSPGLVASVEQSSLVSSVITPLSGFVVQPSSSSSATLPITASQTAGSGGARTEDVADFGRSIGSFSRLFGWGGGGDTPTDTRGLRPFQGTGHTLGGAPGWKWSNLSGGGLDRIA